MSQSFPSLINFLVECPYVHNVRRKNKDSRGPDTALFTGQVNTIWCIESVECPEVTQTANIDEKLNFLVQHWPLFLATVVLHTRSSCAMRDCYLSLTSDSRYVTYSGQIIDLFTILMILFPCFAWEKGIPGECSVQITIETSKYWNYPLITALQETPSCSRSRYLSPSTEVSPNLLFSCGDERGLQGDQHLRLLG